MATLCFQRQASYLLLLLALCALLLLIGLSPRTTSATGETVQVWMTTADQTRLLEQQANRTFASDSGVEPLTIDVSEEITYQVMDGFGASLTDSSAWLIWNRLSAVQRNALLNDLFNPTTGIGLSFLRQPMGASDFALQVYSYDEMSSMQKDPDLAHFSIEHDRAYIIPLLQQIETINSHLRLMASPWSPPGWMKTSDSMLGGKLACAHAPLADYFVKFIQAYAAEGLTIDLISIQNEPVYVPADYPGMWMSPSEQANFIKNYLGPAFAAAGISTKILIWDHNWSNLYPYQVLDDSTARPYIAGTAYHCYSGSVTSPTDLHNTYPDKDIWLTECSGFSDSSFAEELKDGIQTLIIGATRGWARSVVRWNLTLDENNGPRIGGCSNCTGVVTINQTTGEVTRNVDYYVLGHASKFVVPGALRIDSSTFPGSIESVAFKNPDNSKVVITFNADTAGRTFKIRWDGQSFNYTLPAGAVATFKWNGVWSGTPPPPPTSTPAPEPSLPRSGWIASASSSPGQACCAGDVPARAIDGMAATRWSSGVAQQDGQWFQVDMAAPQTFSQVVLDAGFSSEDYPRGYAVYVSNDGTNWDSPVATGSGSPFTIITFPTQTARYMRIVQTGTTGDWWSIYEMHVYANSGLPIRVTPVPATPTPTPGGNHTPYLGASLPLPGVIQAEYFDTGGENEGYHDTSPGNDGGELRPGEGVDIQTTLDEGGGYNVGWTSTGEWLRYAVNVPVTGTYTFHARVASADSGGSFHALLDDVDITGNLCVPNTGGWQTFQTLTRHNVHLGTGQHDLRIVMDSHGEGCASGNYNYFSFNVDAFLPIVIKGATGR